MRAILTGHTRGLGAAIGAALLAKGIPVLGLARGRAPLDSPLLTQLEIDLSDSAALADWLSSDALPAYLAGAETVLLINNAGVMWPVGPLAAQDPLAALRATTLNVAAPLALAAAVVRASAGAQRRILHISSGAGRNAYPGWSVYCATTAALDRHAEAVLKDGDPQVRISSLAPGVIDTEMQGEIRASSVDDFPMLQRFVDLKAQGGLRAADECAEAIVDYLLAPGFGGKPVDDLRNAT